MPIGGPGSESAGGSAPVTLPPDKLAGYRADVDGLRAAAVISVVLYHAFPDVFRGGFLGVDVFFVISGFLISGIVFRELDRARFSFADFYARRVRRIFPSLVVVLAFTYALGWTLLFSPEFLNLAKHIVAGAGFSSNLLLWSETGYFDKAAELKPLLHLWSLGIEEQFYLVFPLAMAAAAWRQWSRRTALVVLFALSFATNVFLFARHPTAAFYFPGSRFWELLLGSLLETFVAGDPGPKRAALWSWIGAVLVIGSVFGSVVAAPGFPALIPVIGAALVIRAGPGATFNRFVLAHPVATWVGRISYPLYLWHWPLLCFARIARSDTPPVAMRVALAALSVVLSWLTYQLVETNLRFGARMRLKTAALAGSMVLCAALGATTLAYKGFDFRSMNHFAMDMLGPKNFAPEHATTGCGIASEPLARTFQNCVHDDREPPRVALVGDSKAEVMAYGLFKHSHPGRRVLFIGGHNDHGAPEPIITDDPEYARFQERIRTALDAIEGNPALRVVVLTAATRTLYQLHTDRTIEKLPDSPKQDTVIEGLSRVVRELTDTGRKVVLVVDNPTLPYPEDCISRKTSLELVNAAFGIKDKECVISYDRHLELSRKYRDALEAVKNRFPGKVLVFDTLPFLCNVEKRECRSVENGEWNYSFTDHISRSASDRIGKALVEAIADFDSPELEGAAR